MSKDYNPGPAFLTNRVVVLPDPISRMTEGGVFEKPNEVIENEIRMQTRGMLIDFSDVAFKNHDGVVPEKLNRVEYARFSGQPFLGDDGIEYIVMNAKELVAIWR